jgi:hypothetical protein
MFNRIIYRGRKGDNFLSWVGADLLGLRVFPLVVACWGVLVRAFAVGLAEVKVRRRVENDGSA